MTRWGILAALFPAAALIAAALPARAIDIHNCTPDKIRLEFYNESDRIELLYKKRIDVAPGQTAAKVTIPGFGTHKVKTFDVSAGNRHLATYRAIDGTASYVLYVDPNGLIAMTTGGGC